MQTLKTLWTTIKKVLWVAWRHALTLYVFTLIVIACMEIQSVNVKNIVLLMSGAALLDWIKMKIKIQSNPSFHHSSDAPQPLHVQNYWNSSIVGSPSYLSSIGSSTHYH
jgi:hypothetical protein